MGIEIDIRRCNSDPETCPVIVQIFEIDQFCAVIEDLDQMAADLRPVLGDFVMSCCKNSCPGQNLETTKNVFRSILSQDDTN